MGKKKIMSLSIDPELFERLEEYAAKKAGDKGKPNNSKAICDLLEKYMVVEEDVVPVILKIPVSIKKQPEELRKWLDAKAAVIVKALSQP